MSRRRHDAVATDGPADAVQRLSDHELAVVLLWLEAPALEAAERVCRRWRRIALSPPMCRAHRPRALVWCGLGDRAAVVAERTTERNWLAGRYERKELACIPDERYPSTHLDGPRLALFARTSVVLFDLETLTQQWRTELPGSCKEAAVEDGRLAMFASDGASDGSVGIYVGTQGTLCATSLRLPLSPSFMMWRGTRVAYGTRRDSGPAVERMDPESGRVTRSLPLVRLEVGCLEFPLADDASLGLLGHDRLIVDDGRCACAALFSVERPPRATLYGVHAHPDGRTLLTVSREMGRNGDDDARLYAYQLWDMRMLGRARVTIPMCSDAEFLSFGRQSLRSLSRGRVHHHDLDTGAPLGTPYEIDHPRTYSALLANEAFAVFEPYGCLFTQDELSRAYTVFGFAGT